VPTATGPRDALPRSRVPLRTGAGGGSRGATVLEANVAGGQAGSSSLKRVGQAVDEFLDQVAG